jgi:DNA-binding IclR family transcriptional regulator/ABC-type sugar transport system substrate-binding protein
VRGKNDWITVMAQQYAREGVPTGTARAATRVLDILELLATRPAGMTLSEVADELEVPISSLHSLMRALEARRYLVRGQEGRRYRLGPQLREISSAYLDPEEPFTSARRALRQVADRSGETIDMAMLAERDVVYLEGVPSRYPLSARSQSGQRLPAHATAAGKALLAALPEADLVALYRDFVWPPATPWIPPLQSFGALQRDLEEVRWTGYACAIEGPEEGLHALAAALPDEPGRPRVALSIAVPSIRLRDNGLWRTFEILREVASPPVKPHHAHKKRRPLLGWSMSHTSNPVFVEMRRAASIAIAQTGGEILWTDAPDELKQASDVQRLLEEPLDALIIQPADAVKAAPFFIEARQHNLLLVCFHRPVRTRALDFFVGSDVYLRGCMQAHAVVRLLHGHGGVFIVDGDAYDDNARSIGQGNRDTLAQYPGLRLLGSHSCEHWLPETAQSAVHEALATFGPEQLNAVIAANDFMAYAIADLLASHGLTDRVVLVGGDGDHRAVELIRSGVLAGTVLQDSAGMAATALDYVLRVLEGTATVGDLTQRSLFHAPEGPPVPALDVADLWIDASNVDILEEYWQRRQHGDIPYTMQLDLHSR